MDLNETSNRVIAIVVAVALIIGAWYLGRMSAAGASMTTSSTGMTSTSSSSGKSGSSMTSGSAATDSTAPSVISEGNDSVSVSNQAAGMQVSVASVALSQSEWVAIRDSNGLVLGAALFPAGMHTDVVVPLLRATEVGQTYQALLYVDDGSKQFDLHKDSIVMNSSGSVVGATFSAN